MAETFARIVRTREEAHAAARTVYAIAQDLMADDRPVRITCGEDEEPISVKQRAFLHAAVFPQIEAQYQHPDGTHSDRRAWKEYFRARFLGDRWVSKRVPRWDAAAGRMVLPKRKTPHRERVSTEDLSIKQYSAYIDTVIDTATLELGVQFVFLAEEREAVRYHPPARKSRAAQPEAVPA